VVSGVNTVENTVVNSATIAKLARVKIEQIVLGAIWQQHLNILVPIFKQPSQKRIYLWYRKCCYKPDFLEKSGLFVVCVLTDLAVAGTTQSL
jgi:hypothetical protein